MGAVNYFTNDYKGTIKAIALEDVVYNYFENVISKSWTWERLTDDERERFKNCIDFSGIKGTARQRVEILNMVYAAFLQGVGYEPIGWREAETV